MTEKTQKLTNILQKQNEKIAKFSINLRFLFGVPKHITHKMVIKGTYVLQKAFLNFSEPQF